MRTLAKHDRGPPKFVAPQLCCLVKTPPPGREWRHEIKFDGYRVQMRVKNGRVCLRTRKGIDWTRRFPEIAAAGGHLRDCLIDGEIVALNGQRISDFGMLQEALSDRRTGRLIYFVFDCLFCDGKDLRRESLKVRQTHLRRLMRSRGRAKSRIRITPHLSLASDKVLKAACRKGFEGVVSKQVSSDYRSGRSKTWVKAKCRSGQEVVIGGWLGTPRKLRSLLVGAYKRGKLVYMGRVGTGYRAQTVEELLRKLRARSRAKSPFASAPHEYNARWVRPSLVAEIEFENVTRNGLLRQAAFKGLRSDKPARMITPEIPRRTRR